VTYNPYQYNRRSIRLKDYDYSKPGSYFITICTHNRVCLFGEIMDGEMMLNDAGNIVKQCWLEIPNHFPHVGLDAFVVMPNHMHGIIILHENANVGENNYSHLHLPTQNDHHIDLPKQNNTFQLPSRLVGSIIRGFKIGVTKWFRIHTKIYPVWQRNYYEHIIRNELELYNIRSYILNNPLQWKDHENFI
jgi:REP element-mobilizing transposase RayT